MVVFQGRLLSHLRYTKNFPSQIQTRVKLNRVFFPRYLYDARSRRCEFARLQVGTAKIALFHSCASPVK